MANGKTCQVCRQNMKIKSNKPEPKGSWVLYDIETTGAEEVGLFSAPEAVDPSYVPPARATRTTPASRPRRVEVLRAVVAVQGVDRGPLAQGPAQQTELASGQHRRAAHILSVLLRSISSSEVSAWQSPWRNSGDCCSGQATCAHFLTAGFC